jgi:hypothetical protein
MKMLFIVMAFLILCVSQEGHSKAGPPIPLPSVAVEEAIALSRKTFTENTITLKNADYFSKFILTSVKYIQDKETQGNNWVWQIIFVHPVDNDCKWCYQIYNNKEIKLIWTSK